MPNDLADLDAIVARDMMVRGEITVDVEGKATVLKEGDSIHFNSRRLHSTWNHGAETATFLWCGTMDVFDEDGADPR